MSDRDPLALIARYRVVPVIAIESVDQALPLADALIAGGLPIIEVTFRTKAALDVIRLLASERPELLVGAGTVLDPATEKANMQKRNDELQAALMAQGDQMAKLAAMVEELQKAKA